MVPLVDLAALRSPDAARGATPFNAAALLPLPGAFVVFPDRAAGAALQNRQERNAGGRGRDGVSGGPLERGLVGLSTNQRPDRHR